VDQRSEPFDNPYSPLLGTPEQHRAWLVPATALHDGLNRVEVHVHAGAPPARIIFVNLTIL